MEIYQTPEEMVRPTQARRDVRWQERIIHMLDETGVRSDSGQHWDLEGVESIVDRRLQRQDSRLSSATPPCLSTRRLARRSGQSSRCGQRMQRLMSPRFSVACGEVIRRGSEDVVVVVGAEFGDGTEPGQKGHRWAVEVMRVKAGPEMHLAGVKDKARTTSMVLVAEPAVKVERAENGELTCTVGGWNEFNPVTGAAPLAAPGRRPDVDARHRLRWDTVLRAEESTSPAACARQKTARFSRNC